MSGAILTSVTAMQASSKDARSRGKTIALVPTMGALHEGHLSLIRKAKSMADHVVTSVFVNPKQFGKGEDFERYPRDLDRDADMAFAAGSDILFAPATLEMYPEGFQTWVVPGRFADVLEGRVRPGHFRGVATVVTKLLNITMPHLALFGQKDVQQAYVVRRLVRDLNLSVRIMVEPTVREPDGLAMSSRNRYLSPEERARAVCLRRALTAAETRLESGERSAGVLREAMERELAYGEPTAIDYIAVLDGETFEPQDPIRSATVIVAVAVRFGPTRLIDNTVVALETNQEPHASPGGTT